MKTTGIVLTAAVVAGGNEWLQTNQIPWRIGISGLVLSWLMGGVEKVSPRGAMALSVTILITALVVPLHGKSPIMEFGSVVGTGKPPTPPSTGTHQAPGTHTAGGRG
jgi:hypothetical protein